MRKLAYIMLLMITFSAMAADDMGETLLLKDGSHLFISGDNTMRMEDKDGNPISMKDGVAMELKDGSLIMMKNKKVWRHDHRKQKGMITDGVEVELEDGSSIMIKDENVWRHDHRKQKGLN
jgi:hypothetical protein